MEILIFCESVLMTCAFQGIHPFHPNYQIYIHKMTQHSLTFLNLFKIVTYLSRLRSWGGVWHFRIFIRSEHLWKEREKGIRIEKGEVGLSSLFWGGCSLVGINMWFKDLHTLFQIPYIYPLPSTWDLLVPHISFFSFWAPDHPTKPFNSARESTYLLILVHFLFHVKWMTRCTTGSFTPEEIVLPCTFQRLCLVVSGYGCLHLQSASTDLPTFL